MFEGNFRGITTRSNTNMINNPRFFLSSLYYMNYTTTISILSGYLKVVSKMYPQTTKQSIQHTALAIKKMLEVESAALARSRDRGRDIENAWKGIALVGALIQDEDTLNSIANLVNNVGYQVPRALTLGRRTRGRARAGEKTIKIRRKQKGGVGPATLAATAAKLGGPLSFVLGLGLLWGGKKFTDNEVSEAAVDIITEFRRATDVNLFRLADYMVLAAARPDVYASLGDLCDPNYDRPTGFGGDWFKQGEHGAVEFNPAALPYPDAGTAMVGVGGVTTSLPHETTAGVVDVHAHRVAVWKDTSRHHDEWLERAIDRAGERERQRHAPSGAGGGEQPQSDIHDDLLRAPFTNERGIPMTCIEVLTGQERDPVITANPRDYPITPYQVWNVLGLADGGASFWNDVTHAWHRVALEAAKRRARDLLPRGNRGWFSTIGSAIGFAGDPGAALRQGGAEAAAAAAALRNDMDRGLVAIEVMRNRAAGALTKSVTYAWMHKTGTTFVILGGGLMKGGPWANAALKYFGFQIAGTQIMPFLPGADAAAVAAAGSRIATDAAAAGILAARPWRVDNTAMFRPRVGGRRRKRTRRRRRKKSRGRRRRKNKRRTSRRRRSRTRRRRR